MNGKKILISSALSLSLLMPVVSASPAFASTENTVSSSTQSDASTRGIITRDIPKKENIFANFFIENGVTWYLKGITYSGGWYIGHYEAND
ncbi:antimicrobial peptide LCI [Lysinibacillus xylanilyticus]|uniref:LCI fold-containing protein n=1 Tax=Lysinibacillus xylanilyticus TaxID=582475 RepID=UPI002B25318A|nr:LCI fold-containing protein [Lysinibacillus xylanilyticus]MEB2281059.1 antimicrobial peptide LCI [Lysinibacillus xylanilyticus]